MSVGFVVIGRNEGQRLVDCLASIRAHRGPVVYVDSGSTDGSQDRAREAGVEVVDLDQSVPFTAARARNEGYARLVQGWPLVTLVQFIDGDCTLNAHWIAAGRELLEAEPAVALVCGRRREKYPDRSIYNAICDSEWDGDTGSILECGGDFLVRTVSFSAAEGFRSSLIAGEEPELCLRLRERGWQIWRLQHEMTLHDANIMHFSQWWRRSVRAGHAFAEVSRLHRNSPHRIWSRNVLRSLSWAVIAPAGLLASLFTPWALLLLLAYPANIVRQAVRTADADITTWLEAAFNVLGKFPETQGILKYHTDRAFGRQSNVIEYK